MSSENTVSEVPTFERDQDAMPVLGLGTFESTGDACRNAVRTAIEIGYRHLDTARMYENEKEVGEAIEESGVSREDLFITTKLQMGRLDPEGVRQACEESLRLLKSDYVDLLLIHWPETSMSLSDTLRTMARLRTEGKIRHLGVSNFTMTLVKKALAATDVPIFCNQVEYHPYLDQGPLLRLCRQHEMAVVAYSPLARGRVVRDERLVGIGEKYGKTPAQVALRWLVQQGNVAAIPKGTSEGHIRENMQIFDFELEKDDFDAVSAFEENRRLIDPNWAPEWDT